MMLSIGIRILVATAIFQAASTIDIQPDQSIGESNDRDIVLHTPIKTNSNKEALSLNLTAAPYKDASSIPKCPTGREGSLEPCDAENSQLDRLEELSLDIPKGSEKRKGSVPRKEVSFSDSKEGIQTEFLQNSFVNMKKGSVPRKGAFEEKHSKKPSVPRKGVLPEEQVSKPSVPRKEVLSEEQVSKPSVPRKGVEQEVSNPSVPRKEVTQEEEVLKPSVPRKEVPSDSEDQVSKPSVPRKEVSLEEDVSKSSIPRKDVPSQEQLLQSSFPNKGILSGEQVSKGSVPRKGVPPLEQALKSSVPRKGVSLTSGKQTFASNQSQPSLPGGLISSHRYSFKNPKPTATIDTIDGQATSTSSSTFPILISVGFIFICVSVVALLLSKKFKEYWYRRQYSRVDFLTDGMYNT